MGSELPFTAPAGLGQEGERQMAARFDTIRTDRLIMRRWRDSDLEPFAELNGDAETMRYFPYTLDRAGSDALAELIEQRFELNGYGMWALEVAASGQFIGFTGLNPIPEGAPGAGGPGAGGIEIGWRLARAGWHQGYATEAARAALGVAFDGVGLAEVWSFTSVLNEPSQAVMRRIGMTQSRFFDHPRIPADDPLCRHVLYHRARPEPA
jgi:RimJ/RimL family protein N-acetyltransferase